MKKKTTVGLILFLIGIGMMAYGFLQVPNMFNLNAWAIKFILIFLGLIIGGIGGFILRHSLLKWIYS